MAFDAGKARVANQLIRDGLDPARALLQAGVEPQDRDLYAVDEVGTPETNPNYGQLVSTSFARVQAESPDVVTDRVYSPGLRGASVSRIRTAEETTTTQTTQITGGGSTVNRVVPTQYEENSSSRALQAEANDLQAQKDARSTAIRAAGGTGRDVLADPEFRRLSNAQTEAEYNAERARTPVPNTGGIVTTVTPGANDITTTQTVDGNFVTARGAGFDPQSQAVEAEDTALFTPARNFSPGDVTADDVGAVGQFQAGTADDVPTTFGTDPLAPQLSPFGEPDDPQEFRVESSAPEPLGPDISPFGEENEFVNEEQVESFDPTAVTADDFAAVGQFQTATPDDIAPVAASAPQAPLSNLSVVFEEDLGGWIVLDDATGNVVADGFDTRAEAEQELARLTGASLGTPEQADVRRVDNQIDEEAQAEADTKARLAQAQQQATIQTRLNQTTTGGDWRVRLRLAPAADYLYKDPSNTLLRPLAVSDGVVFPYVPQIQTSYNADYEKYNLTHSNFRGYFYKSSHVGDIQLTAKFTAQDTREAQYVLAVIHFFRSVTKMFYGKDALRGAPPPFVELSGFGQFQFNNHPCLISSFNYNLPDSVDYIRVDPNNQGLNLTPRRNLGASSAPNTLSAVGDRLKNAGLWPGASPSQSPARADLGTVQTSVNGTGTTTYVPTLIEMQLVLLPMQTRSQVSQLFSLKEFANGSLLKGGFW